MRVKDSEGFYSMDVVHKAGVAGMEHVRKPGIRLTGYRTMRHGAPRSGMASRKKAPSHASYDLSAC